MSLTGISSSSYGLDLYDLLYGSEATNATSSSKSTETSSLASMTGIATTDSADFSRPAEFFSKLQQLKDSDPEKFKQVCSDIAAKLRAAAEERGDTPEGKMLSELAEKFQNVADGGDISQLKPPERPPRPPEGLDAYTQQDQKTLVDFLKDQTNQTHRNSDIHDLMSSIFDEVDQALSQVSATAE